MSGQRAAVIGAGVAGLAAARALAGYGIETHLFDRFEVAEHQEALSAYPETPVWGLFPGWRVAAAQGAKPVIVDAEAVLLANGSVDESVPFAGNTLPGVMAATGLIRLIRRWRLLPGRRFVIIGDGNEAANIAGTIADAGGHIVATVSANDARSLIATGRGGVEAVRLGERTIETDIVVMAVGMRPDLSLAAMAECEMVFDDAQRTWHIWRDDRLRTSVAGVWAAGCVAGATGTDVAGAEGKYAAASMAHALGVIGDEDFDTCRSAFRSTASSMHDVDAAGGDRISQPWRPDARIIAEYRTGHA